VYTRGPGFNHQYWTEKQREGVPRLAGERVGWVQEEYGDEWEEERGSA
jgi:hypothetical protein